MTLPSDDILVRLRHERIQRGWKELMEAYEIESIARKIADGCLDRGEVDTALAIMSGCEGVLVAIKERAKKLTMELRT